jgi:hypothetical protein
MTSSDPLSLVRSDPVQMQRIAFAQFDFDLIAPDRRYGVQVRPGRVELRPGGKPDFIIEAAGPVWAEFAKAYPRPGHNDVVAMIESGHARFEGDALPFFRHLFFVKAVVAALFKGEAR